MVEDAIAEIPKRERISHLFCDPTTPLIEADAAPGRFRASFMGDAAFGVTGPDFETAVRIGAPPRDGGRTGAD